LHEDVDDIAVLVHGPPQILWPTLNRYEQLVQMPLFQITGASPIATEQAFQRDDNTKFGVNIVVTP